MTPVCGEGALAAEFDPLAQQVKPRTLFPLKFEEVLIAAGMAAIALITAANVVVRYLTNISFAFTEEYSVVLMVLVTILGTSLAMSGGRHIRIEYFTYLLSKRGRQIAEIIAMALVILCFGIVLVYGAYLTWDEYRFESLTPGLGQPQWLHTGWLPLLSVFVIARALGRALRMWRGEDS
jgi:TRAP-type C4-dicarboxylate transport system permease small subunit